MIYSIIQYGIIEDERVQFALVSLILNYAPI